MTQKPAPPASKDEFLQQHDASWSDLQTLIASLDTVQMVGPADAAGWNIRDHLAHLRAWEATRIAFLDKRYHWDSFGISEHQYTSNHIDAVNELLRAKTLDSSPSEVVDSLEVTNRELHDRVLTTSDDLLLTPASHFHPDWAGLVPNATVLGIVWVASTRHFNEHRTYIERIVED